MTTDLFTLSSWKYTPLWRAIGLWGTMVAAAVTIRTLLDTFIPPDTYQLRSGITTGVAVMTYLLAGFQTAYKTRHIRAGMLVALLSHVLGHLISIILTGALFFGVIKNDPQMLALFDETGGWGEVLSLWIMLLPFVMLLGGLGAVIGKWVRSYSPGSVGVHS